MNLHCLLVLLIHDLQVCKAMRTTLEVKNVQQRNCYVGGSSMGPSSISRCTVKQQILLGSKLCCQKAMQQEDTRNILNTNFENRRDNPIPATYAPTASTTPGAGLFVVFATYHFYSFATSADHFNSFSPFRQQNKFHHTSVQVFG